MLFIPLKKTFCFVVLFLALSAGSVYCQLNEFFFSQYGSGWDARALGMGGAFLAVSDDSSASSWNPAGLSYLEKPEALISFSFHSLTQKIPEYKYSGSFSGFSGDYSVSEMRIKSNANLFNRLSLSIPVKIASYDFVTQLSYQKKIPFCVSTSSGYELDYSTLYRYFYDYSLDSDGSGGFDVYSISLAAGIFKNLKVGITVNRWLKACSINVKEKYLYSADNYYGYTGEWSETFDNEVKFNISGYSFELGMIYTLFPKINIGFVYKSQASLDVEYSNLSKFLESDGYYQEGAASGEGKIIIPRVIGAGICWKALSSLLLSCDFIRGYWSQSRIKNYERASSSGDIIKNDSLVYPSMINPSYSTQKDTTQFRMGAEYSAKVKGIECPLRGGFIIGSLHSVDGKNNQKKYVTTAVGAGIQTRYICWDVALYRVWAGSFYARDFSPGSNRGLQKEKARSWNICLSFRIRI